MTTMADAGNSHQPNNKRPLGNSYPTKTEDQTKTEEEDLSQEDIFHWDKDEDLRLLLG